MNPPSRPSAPPGSQQQENTPSSSRPQPNQRNDTNVTTGTNASQEQGQATGKKKKRRAGKKKRNRRQSFAAPSDDSPMPTVRSNHDLLNIPGHSGNSPPFYRGPGGRNLSETSLDSEALLDHRYENLHSLRQNGIDADDPSTPGISP
jgi:magnesium transporter